MTPKRLVLSAATLIAALLFVSSPVTAEVVSNQDLPVAFAFTNPCNGETVTLSGTIHSQTRVTINANTTHVGIHQNFNDVKGVGLTTGAKYVLNAAANVETNLNGFPPAEQTVVLNEHLVAQGKVPNFDIHILEHITINANGDVTVSFVNIETACH